MKRQFSIEYRPQIESGEYEVLNDLRGPVQILDWEFNYHGTKVVLAKVPIAERNKDCAFMYNTENGCGVVAESEGKLLVDIPPKNKFEEELEKIIRTYRHEDIDGEIRLKFEADAAELEKIARGVTSEKDDLWLNSEQSVNWLDKTCKGVEMFYTRLFRLRQTGKIDGLWRKSGPYVFFNVTQIAKKINTGEIKFRN